MRFSKHIKTRNQSGAQKNEKKNEKNTRSNDGDFEMTKGKDNWFK